MEIGSDKNPAPSTSEKQEPSQSPVPCWFPRMEPAGKEMSGVQGFVCFLTTPGVRILKLRWPLFYKGLLSKMERSKAAIQGALLRGR